MRKHLALIITLAVVGIGIIVFLLRKPAPEDVGDPRTKDIYKFDRSECPGKKIDYVMNDPYMRGVIEKDEPISIVMNYYSCNDLQVGDVVLYRFSQYHDPVIRRVVAKPGDQFRLIRVEKQGWQLAVNGKFVTGIKGEKYIFGVDHAPPPLALAAESRKGRLPPGELIVFSSFPPGDRDSSIFGLANQTDIVGKVEIRSSEEKQ